MVFAHFWGGGIPKTQGVVVGGLIQAVICGIYHYCDQHRVGTELNGPVCSEQSYRPSVPSRVTERSWGDFDFGALTMEDPEEMDDMDGFGKSYKVVPQ